jgi:DNA-binding SARP family transcriptional activator
LWYTLSLVRRALSGRSPAEGRHYALLEGEICSLDRHAGDEWDVLTFRTAYDRARADGPPSDETRLSAWLAVEAAYGGTFLPDDLYEDWAASLRETIQDQYLDVLWQLGRYFDAGQRWEEALARYRRMLEIDPAQEHVHRALMAALAAGGRRDRALRQYLLCRRVLKAELDVEPEEETAALYRQLLGSVPWEDALPHG